MTTTTAAAASPTEPDAHGQAALMLAESILHALVEEGVLSPDQVASVLRTACEVKTEIATAAGESSRRMHESLALVRSVATSFGPETY